MGDKNSNDVMVKLNKLDKVADTLETASSQLSGVVSQQQLDLLRERITKCESDITMCRDGYEILCERTAAHAVESSENSGHIKNILVELERDYSGLRALTLSAFALATVTMVGLVLCVVYL